MCVIYRQREPVLHSSSQVNVLYYSKGSNHVVTGGQNSHYSTERQNRVARTLFHHHCVFFNVLWWGKRHEVKQESVRMREIEGGSHLYVRAHRQSVAERTEREYFCDLRFNSSVWGTHGLISRVYGVRSRVLRRWSPVDLHLFIIDDDERAAGPQRPRA